MNNGFLIHLAAKIRRNNLKWRAASAMLAGMALLFAFQGFSRADDDNDDPKATPITNCTDPTMTNITHDGRYFLANDLTQCANGTTSFGISITASHVKLELRGHTIQGVFNPGTIMIHAIGGPAGISNIEIAGPGAVIDGDTGIDFENVHCSRVHNLVVLGNNLDGITVNASGQTSGCTASTDNEFRDNIVSDNAGNGITVNGGNENRFINNFFSGNVEGLVLSNANGNVARQNTADGNINGGIDVLGSGNTIEDNTAVGNATAGTAGTADLIDQNNSKNPNGNCLNTWKHNSFLISNPPAPSSCFP
jgi:parallel beta-helix repeat protein